MSDLIKIQTISQVHDFFGLEKPKHPLVSVLKIINKFRQMGLSKIHYSIDLYQITFKSVNCADLRYGRNSYDYQDGALLFVGPGQTLQIAIDEENPRSDYDSWTLLFHPDLIRRSELGRKIDDYTFFTYNVNEALHLSEDEKKTLQEIISRIEIEYSQNIDRHSQELIVSQIKLLLDYCNRYYDRQFHTRSNLNKDVAGDFEQLLKDYFNSDNLSQKGIPSVKYFGDALNLSPYYLSDLLKKETGRNTQEHIHLYLIEKAKTALLNSNESVSQIAYDLGFEYPQHFSKVFKNKTGMSPKEYGKEI
ncbi:transcriptional regulator [Niastella vici]|uniref:Transcriptional regulator n=1 Tax=Niastella vici TaxID=1703345 RepID=A0A1V9FHU6_9BACT|nr:helix-turn-helix domain-containing protein [Niastella vici]OQP57949.1 transcriptional regulator [Niastella vici]